MYNTCMVHIQIRDVPDDVRDALAGAARARGQSMQAYLLGLVTEEARRAANMALLDEVRAVGGGSVAEPGETARELAAIRAERA